MGKRALTLLGMYGVLGILIWLAVAKIIPAYLAPPFFSVVLILMLIYIYAPYFPPLWAKRVGQNGKQATATVLANDFAKAGKMDLWVVTLVDVKPADEAAFKAKMRCKTSQATKLTAGATVSVRYNEKNKQQVLMTG
jgi:hypothetical protein